MKHALSIRFLSPELAVHALTRVNELGYDAVELDTRDLKQMQELVSSSKVKVCSICTELAFTGVEQEDRQTMSQAREMAEIAQSVGAPWVVLSDAPLRRGHSRMAAGVEIGESLSELGDFAASQNVGILIENRNAFRDAKSMWSLLDRLDRPSVACCWDLLAATLAGESPHLSVPVLNSKIRLARVRDARITSTSVTACPFGEGSVPVGPFLKKLRGIGFREYVVADVTADSSERNTLDEQLKATLAKLKSWTMPDTKKPAAPHAAKGAAAGKKG